MEENLPIFEALIVDGDDGIENISLCQFPAIETNFLAFNKQEKMHQKYNIIDEDKRHIITPIMRANFLLYRENGDRKYYVVYSPETLQKMAMKMLADGTMNNINIEHRPNSNVDDIYLIQLFQKNTKAGISPIGFEQIEEGSLFGEYEIKNENIWKQVKDGTFKGVSIEGLFTMRPMEEAEYQAKQVVEEIEWENIQKMIRQYYLKQLNK